MEEIDLSLVRKLLFHSKREGVTPDQRITQGALQAVGELMHQLITETHRRASIEAEFENEMKNRTKKNKRSNGSQGEYDNDAYAGENSKKNKKIKTKRKLNFVGERGDEDRTEDEDGGNTIEPKHILKVSAEVLMDFS